MTRVRVALRVPVGRPLPDLAAFIARCEDAGLDGVGIHDHPSRGRDAYLALALAASPAGARRSRRRARVLVPGSRPRRRLRHARGPAAGFGREACETLKVWFIRLRGPWS